MSMSPWAERLAEKYFGDYFIFLTGNMWDYSAIIAKLAPNRYHR